MKILLRCNGFLRYTIQALSFARQLDAKGYSVYIECDRKWHSIFKLCPYAVPLFAAQQYPRGFKFERTLDMELGHRNIGEFRKSKLKWWAFWASKYPELGAMEWISPFENVPQFTNQIDPKYILVGCDASDSAKPLDRTFAALHAAKIHRGGDYLALGKSGSWEATDLCDLVTAIRQAREVVSINSGVTLIADAVRDSYDHIIDQRHGEQDDFRSPKQRRHKL